MPSPGPQLEITYELEDDDRSWVYKQHFEDLRAVHIMGAREALALRQSDGMPCFFIDQEYNLAPAFAGEVIIRCLQKDIFGPLDMSVPADPHMGLLVARIPGEPKLVWAPITSSSPESTIFEWNTADEHVTKLLDKCGYADDNLLMGNMSLHIMTERHARAFKDGCGWPAFDINVVKAADDEGRFLKAERKSKNRITFNPESATPV